MRRKKVQEMKTTNQIRDYIRKRQIAFVLAQKDAIKFEHAELSASLGELIADNQNILDEIDKIIARSAMRRREIRNTIVMAILGASVAVLALYLMF